MPQPSVSAGEVTALLRLVRGVTEARVGFGDDGGVERIEIAVKPGHSTNRIIRDVESALYTGLGIVVDHRQVSLVGPRGSNGRNEANVARDLQPSGVDSPLGGPSDDLPRIELARVACEPDGELYCEVVVELDRGEERYVGKVREADTPRARSMAAGKATIEALATSLDRKAAFTLEGIEEFAICEHPALIASIGVRRGRTLRSFVGTALTEGSREETAARAVLDALNRFWVAESEPAG